MRAWGQGVAADLRLGLRANYHHNPNPRQLGRSAPPPHANVAHMVRWGANGRIAGCGLCADAPIRRKIAMRTSTPKQERMEPYVCTGARPWERQLSSAAGPTRLARASVVRGGFSASSTSETGLVYRGRSTCVTSSCGCSTSSNSSSLSPLRSSSDIDGYRRESGGVWEGCWELCFVNVRVLPVGELKRADVHTLPRAGQRLYSFFKDTRPPVQSRMGWQCQAAAGAGWRTSRAGAGSRRRPPWSARSGRAARRCLSARGRSRRARTHLGGRRPGATKS